MEALEQTGVDIAIISSAYVSNAKNIEIIQEGNAKVAEIAGRFPDKVKGGLTIDWRWPEESVSEAEHHFSDENMVISGEICQYLNESEEVEPAFMKAVEKVIEMQKPLMFHSSFPCQVRAICGLAERYPEGRFVMAHIGGMRAWAHGILQAKDIENLYIDISGTPSLMNGIVEEAVRILGPDRVLFGSDSRFDGTRYTVERIQHSQLSDEVKQKILYRNCEELLNV